MSKLQETVKQNLQVILWYLPVAVVGVLTSLYSSQLQISLVVNQHHSLWLDYVMYYGTYLGDGVFAVALSLVILYYNKTNGITLLLGYVTSALFAQTLKRLVFTGFNRPASFIQNAQEIHVALQTELHYHNSFPSGHTTTAFVLATLLALMYRKQALWFLLAVLVGYSRIYLFQHFLRDVIFGSFIGVTFGYLSYHYFYLSGKSKAMIQFFTKKTWIS